MDSQRPIRRFLAPSVGAALIAALALAGCRSGMQLQPASTTPHPPGNPRAAVSTVSGVRVVTEPEHWPGPNPIQQDVTPIRVRIENEGTHPVRVQYADFALIAPDGTHYAALPPYSVRGSVNKPILAPGYSPIATPAFLYDGFEVAPYFAAVYPTLPVYSDPFDYDPLYYENYYTYWSNIDLPTPAMLRRALPEGVLEPGGNLDGYLYFERIPAIHPRVTLHFDLTGAKSGEHLGEIRIPYVARSAAVGG